MGTVVAVNVSQPTIAPWAGDHGRTGIDKRPAVGAVRATSLGLVGDYIGDLRHHGGADQAVYAYAVEDGAWWAGELRREIRPGSFGENLSTAGVDLSHAVIGERWAVGGTVLEVSFPRIPCRVFAGFWDVPDLIKRFTARAVPGAYLRVLTEGELRAGDPVEVLYRPDHGVTIVTTFLAFTTRPDLLPALVDIVGLPDAKRELARRRTCARTLDQAR